MRGDSLRDLYAKTLALLGLGVLAGAGALVDYWPIGTSLPATDPGLTLPPAAHALPVRAEDVSPAFTAFRRDDRRVYTFAAAMPAESSRLSSLPVSDGPADAIGGEVELADPVSDSAFLTAPAAPPRALPAVVHYQTLAFVGPATPLPAPAADTDADGLFTGAFKRTGASIAKTGARTGSSIYDAMRAVGDVVRKAIP